MRSTISKSILGALAGASLMLSAGVASATTIAECQALIGTLQTETAAATFVGRNAAKDEAGLLGKLAAASDKLGRAKLGDATQKVNDYKAKVLSLCGEGKIAADSDPTCAELVAGADGVLTCIADIE